MGYLKMSQKKPKANQNDLKAFKRLFNLKNRNMFPKKKKFCYLNVSHPWSETI